MPLTYEIRAAEHLLVVRGEGPVDLTGARDLVGRVTQDGALAAGHNMLVDLVAGQCNPTSADVRMLVDLFSTRPRPNPYRIAVVVGSSFHFGMARMASMLAEARNVHFRVFLDMADAMRWVASGAEPSEDL
jgi:hypothetical protein